MCDDFLDIPLKDLPLKGGEEFVGIVELLENQALQFALLKAWCWEVLKHLTPTDICGNSVPKQFSGSGAWSSGIEYYTVLAFCGSPFKASSVSGAVVLIFNSSHREFQHVMQTAA